jgi:hypothetical protein
MRTEIVGCFDYEPLRTCPFCGDSALWILHEEDCPHYVTAFQDGDWDPDLIPPVFCDGFRFHRRRLTQSLEKNGGVVSRFKPGTLRHPQITVFFCADPRRARELRGEFRIEPVQGTICANCGNGSAAIDFDDDEWRCASCGGPAEPIIVL